MILGFYYTSYHIDLHHTIQQHYIYLYIIVVYTIIIVMCYRLLIFCMQDNVIATYMIYLLLQLGRSIIPTEYMYFVLILHFYIFFLMLISLLAILIDFTYSWRHVFQIINEILTSRDFCISFLFIYYVYNKYLFGRHVLGCFCSFIFSGYCTGDVESGSVIFILYFPFPFGTILFVCYVYLACLSHFYFFHCLFSYYFLYLAMDFGIPIRGLW